MNQTKKTDAPKQSSTPPVPQVGHGDVVISARRLALWYGPVIGINNISIDFRQGVIGLLGPNGAGKSTLMKCLTGQLRPKTGTVTVHKKNLWQDSSVYMRIGLVPEQDAFYEDMTAHEFVSYLTRLQGFTAQEASKLADEALGSLNLADRQHEPIRSYSKGMRQRVKIAQAFAHKPDVLFMDEPLTGTDPLGRRHIIDLIKEMGEQGKTVIVSSHVLNEVEQMTSEVVLINRGRILADGNVYRIREMIDDHPHTLMLDLSEPRKFAALLAPFEDIVSIEFTERGLKVATANPDACYDRIPQLALDNKIALHAMSSPDNNLMAVFKYLVG